MELATEVPQPSGPTDVEGGTPPYDLLVGHMGGGALVTLLVGGVGAAVASPLAGAAAACGVAVGVGVALMFFVFSSLLVGWAELVQRELILPIGIAAYLTKTTLFGVVLFALADKGWEGFVGVPIGIVLGTLAWLGAQVGWVLSRR